MAEQGQVRVDHMQGFHTFAAGMGEVKTTLGAIGSHRHIDLPPGQSFPLADLSGEMAGLRGSNNAAVTRLAQYATRADRGLSGLAFVATYIGTAMPAAEETNRDQVARLGQQGLDSVPPVPETMPRIDPRFESPQETLAERQTRLALPADPVPSGAPVAPGQPG